MVKLLWNILRDFYFVLLLVLIIELIPGINLLHDFIRKAVITVTVVVIAVKVVQPRLESAFGGGSPSGPKRQKTSEHASCARFEWASSEVQGWRPAMEDAVCTVTSLEEPLANQALFAVFDGHGGAQVSKAAAKEFAKVLNTCARSCQSEESKAQELVLTLTFGEREETEDGRSTTRVVCTNLGGEALASVPADLGRPASELRAAICSVLEPQTLIRTVLPDGRVLRDSDVALSKVLEAGAAEAEEDGDGDVPAQGPLTPGALERTLHLTMLTLDSLLRKGGQGVAAKLPGTAGPMTQHLAQVEDPSKRNAFNLVGSTAIVVLIDCGEDGPAEGKPRRLCVANVGDSRAVLCRKGRAEELSQDHKPELPGEEERIRRAGGHVAAVGPCYRIDGWGLNLSRALGDFHYKSRSDLGPEEQKVSVVPEMYTLDLSDEDDEFLLLACDGCFELFTSQGCIDIVRQQLQAGKTTEKAAEALLDRCVSDNLMRTRGRGGDNCSAIVIKLK